MAQTTRTNPPRRRAPTREEAIQYALGVARREGVDPSLLIGLLEQESGWSADVYSGQRRSSAGAIGPAQLMPGTARGLGVDPYNWQQNITGGARYLKTQLERFGNPRLALSAYNSGPGGSEASGSVERIPETLHYVDRVMALEKHYDYLDKDAGGGTAPFTPQAQPSYGGQTPRQPSLIDISPSGPYIAALKRLGPLSGRAAGVAEQFQPQEMPFQPVPAPQAGPAPVPAGSGQTASPSGLVMPLGTSLTGKSEFGVADAEGAPDRRGNRYHAAKDWFAPAGSVVRSPLGGTIVEVKPSRGNSGQIFGGVVKVQDPSGRVFVFRHVDPKKVKVGQSVRAGQALATVTDWRDGSPHAHVEIWRTLGGGYTYENMEDPVRVFGG